MLFSAANLSLFCDNAKGKERKPRQDNEFFTIGTFFKLFKTKQASTIKITSITHEENERPTLRKRTNSVKKRERTALRKKRLPLKK